MTYSYEWLVHQYLCYIISRHSIQMANTSCLWATALIKRLTYGHCEKMPRSRRAKLLARYDYCINMNINTLGPRQNGRHFADDMCKCVFLNENVWIPIEISLKFVPKGSINNNPALFQIMAWRRPGDKPLSEPMMVGLPTHICVTRPQWVNIRVL